MTKNQVYRFAIAPMMDWTDEARFSKKYEENQLVNNDLISALYFLLYRNGKNESNRVGIG